MDMHTPLHGQREPLLLDVAEAARLLGIGERLCWVLVGREEIKSIKLGGRRKVPRSEVERLAAMGG